MGFLLPGDFFGLITRHAHRFAVEAVIDGAEVARYQRGKIERLADFDPRIGRVIREAAFEASSRSQARMLILGRIRKGSARSSSRWRSVRMTGDGRGSCC